MRTCRPRRELGWWSGRAGSLLAGMLAPVADVKARQVAGWSGERGAQAVESGGDLGGPPPGAVNLQADLAGGAGELGGGVRAFLAQDQPRALRPGAQIDHAGGLGHPRAVAQPVVFGGRVPALIGDQAHDVLDTLIDGEPEGEPHPALAAGGG